MAYHRDPAAVHRAKWRGLYQQRINGPAQILGPLPQLRGGLRAAILAGGARVIHCRHDIPLPGQRTGQPRLLAPIATVAVGEHHHRMFTGRRCGIRHRKHTDEHQVVSDQLGLGGAGGGVPHGHFQWANVVSVRDGGGLETDGVVGECRPSQADQEQGGEGAFIVFIVLEMKDAA